MIYEPNSYLDDGWFLDGGGGWNGPGVVGLGRLPLDGGSPFTPLACACPMPDAVGNAICGCTSSAAAAPANTQTVAGGNSAVSQSAAQAAGNNDDGFIISRETLLIAAAITVALVVLK